MMKRDCFIRRAVVVLAAMCTLQVVASELSLVVPEAGTRAVRRVDPKGARSVTVTFDVPASDIQQIWTPDLKQPFLERKWWLSSKSSSVRDMPYMAFFNMAEENRFSFGAAALEWDCEISSKINQEKGVYSIRLTVLADAPGKMRPFDVTLDRRNVVWTRALADWRDSLTYPGWRPVEDAWKPVYCSWYAVHAAVTQDWVERTGAIAADLGFRTFILDDGWSYDEAKRVNPETIVHWYRDVGAWNAFSKAKFPSFREHRERMRKLGLKYVVWVAPYFLGTRSAAYARWKGRLDGQVPFEGNVLTEISDREMMDSVTEQLLHLLKESDLDGLKIDFLDYIRPSMEKPRSRFCLEYVRDLMEKLREVKPDGLFEFRQSYATPITVGLATQFRAGDVPFEWLCNIMRISQIRLTVGDGVPVHADPIYWSKYETRENISRHFMAAMAGVPMLSMDLESMSADERREVRRWLDLYSTRIEPFQRFGKWDMSYRNGNISRVTSIHGNEALVIVVEPGACTPALDSALAGKKTIVLNLAYEPVRVCGIEVAPAAAHVP